MPSKESAENFDQRAAEIAAREVALHNEKAELNEKMKAADDLMKKLQAFEDRMSERKDPKEIFCPVRDGKLYPMRFVRMEPHPETGKMRETTDPEWVSGDHPCLLTKTIPRTGQHFDPYAVIADWRPLRPGERIPEDAVIKSASAIRSKAQHMEELADKAPSAATIPAVVIVNGVVKEAI